MSVVTKWFVFGCHMEINSENKPNMVLTILELVQLESFLICILFSYFRYEEMLLSLNFKQPHDTIHKASPYTCYKNAVLGVPPMKSWASRSQVAQLNIKQKSWMSLNFRSGLTIWASWRQLLVAWIKFRWPRFNVRNTNWTEIKSYFQ